LFVILSASEESSRRFDPGALRCKSNWILRYAQNDRASWASFKVPMETATGKLGLEREKSREGNVDHIL
jgi:hypothetical protein